MTHSHHPDHGERVEAPARHDRHERRERENPAQFQHWTTVAVRYNDLDTQGHVNNAIFFTYFEEARVAFFAAVEAHARVAGHLPQASASARFETRDIGSVAGALLFVIASANAAFLRPIETLAPVQVGVRCASVGRASLELRYIICDPRHELVYASGATIVVSVHPSTGHPRALPHWARSTILAIAPTRPLPAVPAPPTAHSGASLDEPRRDT